jgi:2-oxo-3-(phosphooxy)propyl 3-oxoalkanoate synthase
MNNSLTAILQADKEPRPITFAQTVPRQLVHRAALGEVFLTDMAPLTEREFLCGAQLPRQHAYFSDTTCQPPLFDAVLLMEAIRQSAFVGAHQLFAVPADRRFILPGIRLRVEHPQALERGGQPAEMTILATVTDARSRDGQCTGLDYEMRLTIGGNTVASAGTGMRMRSPDDYRRLRREHRAGRELVEERSLRPIPVPPARVGRNDDRNVVLGDAAVNSGTASATMLVPLDHPSMFDHPQDHIPGMVLVEAARQLALLAATECCGLSATKMYLAECTAEFTRFGELEPATLARATVGQPAIDQQGRIRVPVSIAFSQDLGVICTATAAVQTHPLLPPLTPSRLDKESLATAGGRAADRSSGND